MLLVAFIIKDNQVKLILNKTSILVYFYFISLYFNLVYG